MIEIINKENCCGCSACQQVCPRKCISMQEDSEGFYYPKVTLSDCIDCHLCEKVCPVLNICENTMPINIYGAKCKDQEILKKSSSGGIFTLLASKVISEGGVVFGAAFDDNWEVHHICASTIEELAKLRGSKYVQSRMDNIFPVIERHLSNGRKVLFSGTPCQISALRNYLRKPCENLLCVDVICHGVPSPLVWRNYLKDRICPKGIVGENSVLSSLKVIPTIVGINFRDKSKGWRKYGFVAQIKSAPKGGQNTVLSHVISEPANRNLFMRGFLKNIYLRPSCHKCPSRCGKSGSDITLGDFWGVQRRYPEFHDPMGISLVLVNTSKGRDFFDDIDCHRHIATYDDVLDCNKALVKDWPVPPIRTDFFAAYSKKGTECIEHFCRKLEPGRINSLSMGLKSNIKKYFNLIYRR